MDAYGASIKVMMENLHPTIPSKAEYPTVAAVMEACFSYEADDRPTFGQICSMLNNTNGKAEVKTSTPYDHLPQTQVVYNSN